MLWPLLEPDACLRGLMFLLTFAGDGGKSAGHRDAVRPAAEARKEVSSLPRAPAAASRTHTHTHTHTHTLTHSLSHSLTHYLTPVHGYGAHWLV